MPSDSREPVRPPNQGFIYREQLDARAHGSTALAYLASRYPHSTRDEWRLRLAEGQVELDGCRAQADDLLHHGQVLGWHRPGWTEPDVPLEFSIVYEDSEILAVNKPTGLPTLPGGGFLENTLMARVKLRDQTWDPMHRLGRGTSGLVLFARGDHARAEIQRAMRSRSIEKRYLGLAQGRVVPQVLCMPIGRIPHPLVGLLHAAEPTGKPSETRVVGSVPRGSDSLLELELITGRPHQIRIHLAACGHPLVGDPLYRSDGTANPEATPGDLGYHLHSWRLALDRPARGRLELEAPPPLQLAPL